MSTISDIGIVSLENFILAVIVVNFISLSFIPGCEVQFPTKAQDNQRGLTRKINSLCEPIFYPYTVFRQPRPLPESALNCR